MKTALSVVRALLCVVVLLSFVGVAHAGDNTERNVSLSQVRACYESSDPKSERNKCYVSICEDVAPVPTGVDGYFPHSVECGEAIIDAAISGSDSAFANAVLRNLIILRDVSGRYWMRSSAYGLAQRIGQMLAKQSIVTGKMLFIDCVAVDDINACSHGFFNEIMSLNTLTQSETAIEICNTFPSASGREICYHQIGSVLLARHEREVTPALEVCDTLPQEMVQHCGDGVFAENVDYARVADIAFDNADILAPCSQIDDKYRQICYRNHGPYILQSFNRPPFNFADPTEVCLGAEGDDPNAGSYIAVCEQSVQDALTANPVLADQIEYLQEMQQARAGDMNDIEEVQKELQQARETLIHQEPRSWFQRLIDFITGLFTGG